MNVCGLKTRLRSPEFEQFIQNYDLICLTETKLSEIDNIAISGFKSLKKNRKTLHRASGGVALLLNENNPLCKHVNEMYVDSKDQLWVELHVPRSEKCIVLGIIYNPPDTSRYKDPNFFDNLESTLTNISSSSGDKSVILLGDFNARTGTLDDILENDNVNNNEDLNTKWYIEIANAAFKRTNTDTITNSNGPKLVEFCKNTNMIIIYGRCGNPKT